MSSATIQRRRFLKSIGLGMGVASLPFYSLIERSVVHAADAAQPPFRLLLLHSGWGGPWDYLRPTGVTDNTRDIPLDAGKLTFANSILEPLKAFTSKMLVIEGVGLTAGLMPLDANTHSDAPRRARQHRPQSIHWLGHQRCQQGLGAGEPFARVLSRQAARREQRGAIASARYRLHLGHEPFRHALVQRDRSTAYRA